MIRQVLGAGILLALLLAPTLDAGPCVAVRPPNQHLTRDGDQRAYCFYRDGWQDLVLQLAFTGDVKDFGIILALPSVPRFRKVDSPFFEELKNLTWTASQGRPGGLQNEGADSRGGAGGAEPPAVEVVRQQISGAYQAVTLKARAIDALTDWLDENGYAYPENAEAIFQEFVDMEWFFVAVKVVREDEARDFSGRIQPMGFRFQSELPLIATRFAALVPLGFSVNMYFVADSPVFIGEYPTTFTTRVPEGGWAQRGREGLDAQFPLTRVYSAPLTRAQVEGCPTFKKILEEDLLMASTDENLDKAYEGLFLTRLMGYVDQATLDKDLTIAPEKAWDAPSARQILRALRRSFASDRETGRERILAAAVESRRHLPEGGLVESMADGLASADYRVRLRSAEILGQHGGKAAVPALIDAMASEEDGYVRKSIRDALARITGEKHSPQAVDRYREWWEKNR